MSDVARSVLRVARIFDVGGGGEWGGGAPLGIVRAESGIKKCRYEPLSLPVLLYCCAIS